MTFEDLCKLDDRLLALYQEAGAFRVVSVKTGQSMRTCDPARAANPALYKPDQNFCRQQLWRGLPGKNGEVGLLDLMKQIVGWAGKGAEELRSAEAYDSAYHTILDAIPPCQHNADAGCRYDYPAAAVQPCAHCGSVTLGSDVEQSPELTKWICQCRARRESLKRNSGPVGFGGLIEQLRNAGRKAAGEQELPIEWIDGTKPPCDDKAEPVFIVKNEEAAWNLMFDLNFKGRLAAGEITRWYARNAIYICDSAARKVLLSKNLTKDSFYGAISWKPVVLTFRDEALERKLATVCAQVITIEPDKDGSFELERVQQAVKEIAPTLNLDFPDMPKEVLDGWLGEVCRSHMADLPIAYSWPALLSAASVLLPPLPGNIRANLYVGLIGGVGSGKTSAFEKAFWLMQLKEPILQKLKSGSGEGMAEYLGDLQGAKRLVFVNELAHLLAKVNYQGSTFEQFLNDAYYDNKQTLTIARGRQIIFDCCLTLTGGLPESKFEELFGLGTIGGFHDRAVFGVSPTKIKPFPWKPLVGESPVASELISDSENPESEHELETSFGQRPKPIAVDVAVWAEKTRWQKEYGIGGRAAEAGIRAAIIAAAFDCRDMLRVDDLGPALAFARYQEFVHKRYAPNPGKTNEGIAAHKMLTYLKQHAPAPECKWLNRRNVILHTSCHDFGPGVAIRALIGLESVGEIESNKSGRQVLVRLNPDRY